MHTALPQHGREIKGLCLFSVNVRPYSVRNPHIDSFILPSMHYMPTCFQQKWYICEWSWPCERKSVQNVENQASVTQGKKERQLWRQKHSTVQGQSQPIECRFFFVLCSFTLSACLVPSACWHLSYCVILAGWGNYKGVVWGMYVLFWFDGHLFRTFIIEYECESGSRLSSPMHYECRLSEHQREKNSDLWCKRVRDAQVINGPEESIVVRGLSLQVIRVDSPHQVLLTGWR